jgi:hypothetical protein
MESKQPRMIHALEFDCQAPLKFYEHCAACPRFGDDCPDLALGKEILRGGGKLIYNGNTHLENGVDVNKFQCLAPLYYFEKSRKQCGHEGRCREEGLLLALLSGKKELVYAQKTAIELPRFKARHEKEVREDKALEAVAN